MSKLNKILIGLLLVLLVAMGAVLLWQKMGFEKSYWAVYTVTGDLYFGKLSHFPKLSMTDVWFLQRNTQDTQNPLSLAKFENVFWAPESRLYLDEKNIVWKAKLKSDSSVVKYIKNPPAQTQQTNQPAQSNGTGQPKSE